MDHLARGEWGEAILLEYVVVEVVTVIAARREHHPAVSVGDRLIGNRDLEFVPCSRLFSSAFEVFRSEHSLSFVDAAIVAVARSREARVATFDRDFAAIEELEIVP